MLSCSLYMAYPFALQVLFELMLGVSGVHVDVARSLMGLVSVLFSHAPLYLVCAQRASFCQKKPCADIKYMSNAPKITSKGYMNYLGVSQQEE